MTNEKNTKSTESTEPEAGEPTEIAKALHGDKAAVETNPQPEVITLPGDTRIAVAEEDA